MLLPGTVHGFTAFLLHTLLYLMWRVVEVAGSGGGGGGGGGAGGPGHGGGGSCPRMCFCNTLSKIVYCSRRGLPFIPHGIPRDSLQLNLNGNAFTTTALQRTNFSRLQELEHLYMSDCNVEEIEVDTFVDLVNLEWLDLSNNRIKVIQDYTFRGLTLMHLFLNGNRNLQLSEGSFEGLVTTGLYLHDCSLDKLRPEVLSPLNSTLRYLWMNGNEIDRVDKLFLPLFATLSHLRLGSNPLHCNCEVVWLKEFYDKNGDIFSGAELPSCLTPQRLKGKFFNEVSLFDLRCQPPVFNNIDAVFDTTRGRLRCTASGDPAPVLYWIQPTGRTSKFPPPPNEDARKNEGVLMLRAAHANLGDELAGMYICVANNEAGNVTLTINVSWPQVKPPLTITYRTLDTATTPGSPTSTLKGPLEAVQPRTPTSPNNNNQRLFPTPPPPPGAPSVPTAQDKSEDSSAKKDKDLRRVYNSNYTALNMLDFGRRRGERLFNLTELIGAVIGTHVCTLLLCLIFMPIYYKRKWRQLHARGSGEIQKAPPAETLYLNGKGHHPIPDYMDTPATSPAKR